jgi:hypothetical protein
MLALPLPRKVLSTSITSARDFLAYIAALRPANPEPIIRTSVLYSTVPYFHIIVHVFDR